MNNKRLNSGELQFLFYKILREELERHNKAFDIKINYGNEPLQNITEELRNNFFDLSKQEQKNVKIRFVVEAILYDNIPHTIEEIAAFTYLTHELDAFIPTISSSSIQRYLHNPYVRAKYGEEVVEKIESLLKYNYETGKSLGGTTFASRNDSTREANGSFNGSVPSERKIITPSYTSLVEEQARLFLGGKSYEDIACMYTESLGHEVTATDIKRTLTLDLKKVNKELYKEVEAFKQEARQSALVEEKNKFLNIYHLYVEKDMTYSEIADIYKTSVSSISRLLGQRMVEMAKKFPEDITPEMIEEIQKKRKQNENRVRAAAR